MQPVEVIDYLSDSPPAPGRLALVQAFVNTVDHEHGREMLYDPDRLEALLSRLGLLEAGTRAGHADLRRAHALREALRRLALANNGVELPTDVPGLLEDAARDLVVRFDGAAASLGPAKQSVNGAFADLVGIVYTAMADGTWPRLKSCRRDVCGWLFYDHSRNRSAVWCSMAVCGNRTKTKAYRARGAARRARTGRR